jgi:hypothetical protein
VLQFWPAGKQGDRSSSRRRRRSGSSRSSGMQKQRNSGVVAGLYGAFAAA